jgi:hypothetical protein
VDDFPCDRAAFLEGAQRAGLDGVRAVPAAQDVNLFPVLGLPEDQGQILRRTVSG